MITNHNSYPKAILFDMDGVLIDSKDAWWKAINVALSSSHHPILSKEKFDKHLWGNDFKQSLSYLGIKEKVFLDCKEWPQTYLKNVKIKKDVNSTLPILQNHFSLAVITNTQRFITTRVLKQFNLTRFFEEIVCADDVTKGKPSPEMILHACKSLGISTADALVIGDTKIDFQAAQKAGCDMIGMNFNNGGRDITHISELLDLLLK